MFNSTRRQSQHMKRRGFQRGNEHSAAAHAARWGEREVIDAGAPAFAPRAPYPPPSGALIAPPTTLVQPNRPLQLPPLLRTAQPQQSHGPGRNAKHPPLPTYVSSSLPVHATALCTHAPMRTAAPPTALRGRLPPLPLLRWLLLHRSSPSTSAAQQPASPVRPLSACRCTRPVARARSTGLRPGYGCSPAMPNGLRMPAMLTALRRQTACVTRR